jgi:hypothetical protein
VVAPSVLPLARPRRLLLAMLRREVDDDEAIGLAIEVVRETLGDTY